MDGNSLDTVDDSALGLYEVQSSLPTSLLVTEENISLQMQGCDDQMVNCLGTDIRLQQQVAAFRTLDGQLVYVTYPMVQQLDPVPSPEPQDPQSLAASLNDVCAESTVAAMTLESLAKGLLLPSEEGEAGEAPPRSARRKPVEPIVGSEVGIEEKLEVRDAMLGALPAKKNIKQGRKPDARYDCDMCEASFRQPTQLYGHMKSHTGERKFPCLLCAPGKAVFDQAARLAVHEKRYHMLARRHECLTCGDSFDRASQLEYHTRRIHLDEKAYCCRICSKGFFKKSDLKTHLNLHLGISTHTCPTCGKHFSHVSNLTRHVRTHTGIKPYVCSDCGRRFSQPSAMISHKTSHSGNQRVSCLVCTRSFQTLALMRRHVRHSHPAVVDGDPKTQVLQMKTGPQVRRYYCAVCGDSFQFATQLHSHELQHAADGIQCSSCQVQLPSIDHLKSHSCEPAKEPPQNVKVLASHTKQDKSIGEIFIYIPRTGLTLPTQVVIKPVSPNMNEESLMMLADEQVDVVDACKGLQATQENEEENEEEQYGDQEAQVCIEVFESESRNFLLPHVLDLQDAGYSGGEDLLESPALSKPDVLESSESHDQNQAMSPSPTQQKKRQKKIYHCPECGKQFSKNGNYKQHLGTHFVDQQKHTCSVCERVFAWKSTLNKHMLQQHSDAPATLYSCEQCERHYSTLFQVQEHVKRDHNKERSHVCSECNKSFYKKHDLKVHTRTHTMERPYMCGTCGRRFTHPSHIIRHERTHTGLRPYKCHCGRAFTQSNSLLAHQDSHGGMRRPYRCECGRAYASPETLQAHRQSHHPD